MDINGDHEEARNFFLKEIKPKLDFPRPEEMIICADVKNDVYSFFALSLIGIFFYPLGIILAYVFLVCFLKYYILI